MKTKIYKPQNKFLIGDLYNPLAVCIVSLILGLVFKPVPLSGQTKATIHGVRVRIKDVTRFANNEKYTVTGYGLVVGLAGTGDSDESLIQRTIANMVQNFNVMVAEDDVKAQNCASVMVTATVSTFAHKGDMIHATVSSVGDASSLKGGELLLTPLLGPDATVWAVAQGPVTTGGFSYGSSGPGGQKVVKNHPTVGMLTNGVKLLKDITTDFGNKNILTLYLEQPDFTSVVNLCNIINKHFIGCASPVDASTIKIFVPKKYREAGNIPEFISAVEQLDFTMDDKAKVVFNERTGTIVIGAEVKISAVAVSHGNITVNIKKIQEVSQPAPFSKLGTTKVTNDETTQVKEEKVPVFEFPATTTVGELVDVLNALGVTPRDIMVIFHALKEAGALHAELQAI